MKTKRIIILLALVLLLFAVSGAAPAFAEDTEDDTEIDFIDEIDKMEAEGKYSNEIISSIFVEFTDIMTSGSAVMVAYEGAEQYSTVKDFSTEPLAWDEAEQQLVKYVLGNIANLYRAEYDTEITCKTYEIVESEPQPRMIIPIYVYGPYKAQAIAELFNGIPDCFTIEYQPPKYDDDDDNSGYSGNLSVPIEPIPTPVADYSQYNLLHLNTMLEVLEAIKTSFETSGNDFTNISESIYLLLLFFNCFNFG